MDGQCGFRIPDTTGGEHDCGRPAVSAWVSDATGAVPMCRKHDERAQRLSDREREGWERKAIGHAAVLA